MAFQDGNKKTQQFSYNPEDWYDWENIKVKRTPLNRSPLFTDDHTQGYDVFSIIVDFSVSPRRAYICVDPSEGAAIWREITGSGGGGGSYTNANPSVISVGGIPAGTTFLNTSFEDFVTMLLYPELFPSLIAPNSSFILSQSGFQEIGNSMNLSFSANFNRGQINPAYGTSGFRSGLPNRYNYTGIGLPASELSTLLTNGQGLVGYTILNGNQSWTNTVQYDGGEQPLSSSGNPYDSPLPAGTTAVRTVTITGVYPYFGTSANITLLTKQPLAAHDSAYVEIAMIGEDGVNKQTMDFPVAWSAITGIQQYNPLSTAWEWITGSKIGSLFTFTQSATTHNIHGNVINYTRFAHNGPTIGARQLRFYTT